MNPHQDLDTTLATVISWSLTHLAMPLDALLACAIPCQFLKLAFLIILREIAPIPSCHLPLDGTQCISTLDCLAPEPFTQFKCPAQTIAKWTLHSTHPFSTPAHPLRSRKTIVWVPLAARMEEFALPHLSQWLAAMSVVSTRVPLPIPAELVLCPPTCPNPLSPQDLPCLLALNLPPVSPPLNPPPNRLRRLKRSPATHLPCPVLPSRHRANLRIHRALRLRRRVNRRSPLESSNNRMNHPLVLWATSAWPFFSLVPWSHSACNINYLLLVNHNCAWKTSRIREGERLSNSLNGCVNKSKFI